MNQNHPKLPPATPPGLPNISEISEIGAVNENAQPGTPQQGASQRKVIGRTLVVAGMLLTGGAVAVYFRTNCDPQPVESTEIPAVAVVPNEPTGDSRSLVATTTSQSIPDLPGVVSPASPSSAKPTAPIPTSSAPVAAGKVSPETRPLAGNTAPSKPKPESKVNAALFTNLGPKRIEPSGELKGAGAEVSLLAVSGDARQAVTAGKDGVLRIWDITAQKLVREVSKPTSGSEINCLTLSSDATTVVSGWNDGTVRIGAITEDSKADELRNHSAAVTAIAMSRDGKHLVSAGLDQKVVIYDFAARKVIREIQGPTRWTRLAVSLDGERILCGGWDGTVRLYTLDDAQPVHVLKGHVDIIHSLEFLPQADVAVSGSWDGTIRKWDLKAGKSIARWEEIGRGATRFVLSPDSTGLLIAGPQGIISFWDLAAENVTHELQGHHHQIADLSAPNAAAGTAASLTAISAGWDGTVRVWNLAKQN